MSLPGRQEWIQATRRSLPAGWCMGNDAYPIPYRVAGPLMACVWPTAGYRRWSYTLRVVKTGDVIAYGSPQTQPAEAFAGADRAIAETHPPPRGWSETL